MKSSAKLLIAGIITSVLAGCNQASKPNSGAVVIDQANICDVNAWTIDATSAKCKKGQKIVFLPSRWGNEQLPIMFAAVNCDLRYSVALTNGGVTCIYNPITPRKQEEPNNPDAQKPPDSAPANK